jgi:N-hydroxyarylamine O-acetyltransferase
MPSPERYLARIGLDPDDVDAADFATLERLQRAHVTTVPFETLAITGDPHGEREGAGVTLTLPHCYETVVERERGGYCFELNGLFGWLLRELGYDVDRIAARVVGEDGDDTLPANHHSLLVHLDEPYVTDVGLGGPRLRRPLPLDGRVREDEAGYAWRVVEIDRPDVDHAVEQRAPGAAEWSVRYVFETEPRMLSYFAATCDYLQSSPDSPFTGDPVVSIATGRGRTKLTADTVTRFERGEERATTVAPDEWHDVLEREFGLDYRFPSD